MLMLLMISPTLTAIPSADAKNANLYFLDVVQQANTIFHLFDKQFNDHLMPLIRSVVDRVGSALGLPMNDESSSSRIMRQRLFFLIYFFVFLKLTSLDSISYTNVLLKFNYIISAFTSFAFGLCQFSDTAALQPCTQAH